MELLKGNTYLMPVKILDSACNVVTADRVVKGEFVFGELVKMYGEDGEVQWSASEKAFIVPLSEEETFALKSVVRCQGRLLLVDGSVSGSIPETHNVWDSIGTTRLSEGGAGANSGQMFTMKLMKEISYGGGSSGGITQETDPTVPQYVKNITEGDISNWNNKSNFSGSYDDLTNKPIIPSVEGLASEDYVDKKVADLVNSAPETLDTLGEVAQAIKDNEDVVDALNSAIGERLKKNAITLTLKDNGAYTLTINKE